MTSKNPTSWVLLRSWLVVLQSLLKWAAANRPPILNLGIIFPSHDKGWATRDERRREWEGTSRHIPTVFLLTSLHSSRIVRRRRSRRLETETSGMGCGWRGWGSLVTGGSVSLRSPHPGLQLRLRPSRNDYREWWGPVPSIPASSLGFLHL